MRGSRSWRVVRATQCRRSPSSFYELYGRPAEPPKAVETEPTRAEALSSSTAGGADAKWVACRAALQRVEARRYTDPSNVPPELPRSALVAMLTVLTTSPMRRCAASRALWQDALALRALTPVMDVAAAADAAAVLLCTDQAAAGYDACLRLLQHVSFHQRLETSPDVAGMLRLVSVWVLCGAAVGRRQLPSSLLSTVEAVLLRAKATIAATAKAQRAELAHAVEVLAWSLDWLSGDTASDELAALRPHLPRWLLFLFEPFSIDAARDSSNSFAVLPPRWLRAMASSAGADKDHQTLERLLRHAQRVEAGSPSYRLFQLSPHIAGVLVSCFPRLPVSVQAVDTYATALPCDALRHFGSTKDGFQKTVAVLSSMAGPTPYFVLRGLLQRRSPEAAAAAQEAAGDVLTGIPELTWATALRFTTREVAGANPQWRTYLPETLRLLSDAGKTKEFWGLLSEYNPSDAATNVSVAASLAQAMCRSGRWWHAMEVMDLLATALPPRIQTEEGQLAAACTDTLCALHQGGRWREALDVLAVVGDAVPKEESAVVSQLLTSLPPGAPWEAALRWVQSKGFAVHNTGAVLRVLHDCATSPLLQLSRPQQRVAVPLLTQRGSWELLRELAQQQQQEGDDGRVWLEVLRALECCPDVVSEAAGKSVVSSLPSVLAGDPRTFRLVAQLCLQHGWQGVLDSYLRSFANADVTASSAPLAGLIQEYRHLAEYVRTGTRPPLTFSFTDPYVIHRFVAAVAAQQLAVVATLPDSAGVSKTAASTHLRVPLENLGTLHHRRGASSPASVKVYAAPASACLLEHVLHVSHVNGVVFCYKVAGVNLFSAARGALQTLRLPGVYAVAYNMSAASSGVFVLLPATTSLRLHAYELRVRLCLAPRTDAPVVPLLATTFFAAYAMTWQAGTAAWNEVEAAVVVERRAAVQGALRTLKRDINAEGWGLVETEAGAGDRYHIQQVRCSPRLLTDVPEEDAAGAVIVTCGPRSLKPLNADADAVSWWNDV